MTDSQLTKHQVRVFGPRPIAGYGTDGTITASVRFDDQCGNGHNTFSITCEVVTRESRRRHDLAAGGCMHDEVARMFPELAPFVRWHLCSTNGPMHYVANTMYHLGRTRYVDAANLEHARRTAIWPDMPEGFMSSGTLVSNAYVERALLDRLAALLKEFRRDVESLGFTW